MLHSRHVASQSPAVLQQLLRSKLGFKGVVVTDSIEAVAVRATGSTEQAAIRSIEAGNGIVLTTGRGSWLPAPSISVRAWASIMLTSSSSLCASSSSLCASSSRRAASRLAVRLLPLVDAGEQAGEV